MSLKEEIKTQTHKEERPCNDAERRWPSTRREAPEKADPDNILILNF